MDDALHDHTLAYAAEAGASAPTVEAGATIGRYRLLELVGTGGMGMVWGAWDPNLERRVALKLLRIVGSEALERMLREGQVLARLSHPNVVPIYDVGSMADQVYLVMEWVRGTTLRVFAKDRPTEHELLDAFRQAGAGLAAAHDAGVVHRDFKPANAIRGDDGRVRVLDFGIAHAETTATAAGGGTPRYMAPEQRRGGLVTAAADQYAFCISLLEAFGPDSTPGWVAALIERGTDPDPARRFPSMRALLDALDRDPARRRRRAAVGLALAAAATTAFAIGRTGSSSAQTLEPCSGAADELARSWSPAIRARVVAHLGELGPLGATAHVADDLDRYGAAWIATHDRSCRSHERRELPGPIYDTRLTCLMRTRSQLATVAELMTSVTVDELPRTLVAAHSLPDVEACADIAGPLVPPPAAVAERVRAIAPQVERALVLATAQRADAAPMAHAATALALETGYDALIARALLVEGRAIAVDLRQSPREAFAEATRRALRASDDVLAVEAHARWIFELARRGEVESAQSDLMTAVAERLGDDGRFARALLYNNRAVAYLVANDQARAKRLLDQASAAASGLGDLELLSISANQLRLEGDPDAYAAGVRARYSRLAAILGTEHPDVLQQRLELALVERDRTTALAMLRDACAGFSRLHVDEVARLCTFEAAMLALDGDDRDGTSALMADVVARSRALELRDAITAWFTFQSREPDDTRTAVAETYLAIAGHAPDLAAREAALAHRLDGYGEASWQRRESADGWIVLGQWARAEERFRPVAQPIYRRRSAQIQRGLARTVVATDPVRARALAGEARTFYARDPSAGAARAELDAVLMDSAAR